MAHAHRFFVAPEQWGEDDLVNLSADEAHHAQHVLRVRAGDTVELFDGAGRVASGVVTGAERHGVRVEIQTREAISRPPQRLVLVQAALNREKNLEAVLQRATELGLAEVRVFRGDHSERTPRARDKWRRLAIESCKQCGRVHLPTFTVHPNLESAIAGLEGAMLVAALNREPVPIRDAVGVAEAAAVIVGPEGDLSNAEMNTAVASGAKPISLGRYVLRSEFAATVACVLVADALRMFGTGP